MTEIQIGGILIVLFGSLPVYGLAVLIQRKKLYSLFAGWNPKRITDHDACGQLYCKSLKQFALVLALTCIPMFLNYGNLLVLGISLCVLPAIPLIWAMFYARKHYLS